MKNLLPHKNDNQKLLLGKKRDIVNPLIMVCSIAHVNSATQLINANFLF